MTHILLGYDLYTVSVCCITCQIDCFLRYNFIGMIMNGPGHIIKNFVLDFMHLITNEGKYVWSSMVTAEHGIQRFMTLTGRSTCPWHVTQQSLEYVTELLESGSLKVRSGWTRINDYVGNPAGWKIAECVAMVDDQGIYIFSLLQFNNTSYKEMFVKFFKLLQNILRHDISDVELETIKTPMWAVC